MAHGHHDHDQHDLQNPNTSHETSDVNIRAIIWFVAVLVLSGVVINGVAYGVFMALDRYEANHQPDVSPLATPAGTPPPEPRLQTTPWTDLKVLRQEESDYLNGYGWIDQSAGVARIPIEKAKALLLQRGIPVRQGPVDPLEGTHAAWAFGQSNSARGIPAGGPDKSGAASSGAEGAGGAGSAIGAGAERAGDAAGTGAAGAAPAKKPGGGL